MFFVSMFSSLAVTLFVYAVIDKIVWLAWVAWSLLMIAIFLYIKADCKRMDKDREYEDKIKELEKSIDDIILKLKDDGDRKDEKV